MSRARNRSSRSSSGATGWASATGSSISWPRRTSSASSPRPSKIRPAVLVLDSVQTIFSSKLSSSPGRSARSARSPTRSFASPSATRSPTFLIGHITKEGSLAGPKSLEHMVDVVLLFEGERDHSHRVLRALKNRFGPVSELAIFEMAASGLRGDRQPLGLLPQGAAEERARQRRRLDDQGHAAAARRGPGARLRDALLRQSAADDGRARPLPDGHAPGRDREEARATSFAGEDIYLNVAGGITIEEPAADLGVVLAVVSCLKNRPVPNGARRLRRGRPERGDPVGRARPSPGSRRPPPSGSPPSSCPQGNVARSSGRASDEREAARRGEPPPGPGSGFLANSYVLWSNKYY